MKIQQESLSNGLTVLFVHDNDCPSTTIMTTFKVGARYEVLEKSGIAHLIEHNIFKGTHKRPSSKILSFEIENLGAYQNAFTSKDNTSYYLKGPKDKAEKMLDILADMVNDPIFPEVDFEKEKKVIIEEIKMYEDVPQEKVYDYFIESLFAGNQLAENIAGKIETVQALTTDDCKAFMKQYYFPNNMVIVVSGSFDEDAMLAIISDRFGSLTKKAIISPEKFSTKKLNLKIEQHKKKIEQTHIMIGGFAPDYLTPHRQSLLFSMGKAILSVGMGSKLHLKIREELGLAYYIGMGTQAYSDCGYYYVGLGVDHARVTEAVMAVFDELREFINGNVSAAELERAKNLVIGSMTTAFETSDDLASWYGRLIVQGQELISGEEVIEMIKGISLEEIIATWKNWLTNDNLQIVTFGSTDQDLSMVKL